MRAYRRRHFLPGLALLLAFAASGCSLNESYPLGSLAVRVVNQNDVAVPGILLDLYKVEGTASIYWRASATSSNGVGAFGERDGGVIAGEYFIRVLLTPAYELAPGESNDRPVTVREGDDLTITFRLVPRSVV